MVVITTRTRVRCIFVLLHFKAKLPINPAYPKDLKTIGDKLRKARLDKGMTQFEVAKIIGVTTDTITNWELNRNQPTIQYHPTIIFFIKK